ncbi:MAG: hypothetical protein Q8O75_02735 [bacterium]|nr:hypothetical protein [bacterium]
MPRVEITDGPSKMDLMLGLFDPIPFGLQRRLVHFKIKGKVSPSTIYYEAQSATVAIYGCSRKTFVIDSESWDIEGEIVFHQGRVAEVSTRVTATYNTRARRGVMEIDW